MKLPGPVHENVAGSEVEFPIKITAALVQVIAPPVAEITGGAFSAKTVAVATDVQLLSGEVTVSE